MKTFVVGLFSLFDNELVLEKINAPSWREAVIQHTKYPFAEAGEAFTTDMSDEDFKQQCFDCDCIMSWIEV